MGPAITMKPRRSFKKSVGSNENGAVLVIGLVFLVLLAMTGTTAMVITSTDMRIGGNYKTGTQAFWDAEAGVNFGLAMMEAGLKASPASFSLPTAVGDPTDPYDMNSVALTAFSAPTGFGFSFTPPGLTMLDTNLYTFTSAGTAANNSNMTITVTCRQRPAITMAAFGDSKLDIKNNAIITGYNSADAAYSNPATALTHEADIGSNGNLRTSAGSSIDGNGILGESVSGVDATDNIGDPSDFYGSDTPVDEERIDPDPLGVTSGGEFDPTTYSASNDNALATGLVGNTIAGGTLATLYGGPAGATANYYLTDITVNNADALTIDTSGGRGDVRIFLTGGIDLKNGSQIVMIPASYDASRFAIFSNATDGISIKNSADFKGLIYAPYSTNVDIMNGADFYGAVWGSDVELKNSGDFHYDGALGDKFLTKDLELLTWRDVRN